MFMGEVGLRPEQFLDDQERIRSSPGEFIRINLNPIRPEYIERSLTNTLNRQSVPFHVDLCERYPGNTLQDISKKLYDITGGHPRTLLRCLDTADPLAGCPHVDIMIDELKVALNKYPSALLRLVNGALQNAEFNLSEETQIKGRLVSLGFLASRLHAGYSTNYRATKLVIPPPILNYIVWSNFEYVEYLQAYSRVLKDHYVDKARVFEEIFIKWIQARCRVAGGTFKQVMAGFCPDTSILSNVGFLLTENKIKRGPQILANSSPDNHSTVAIVDFAQELSQYLTTHEFHAYFPAKNSQSPDIMLIPPIKDTNKVLIGVQAKCRVPDALIYPNSIKNEVLKLKAILAEVRKFAGCEKTQGVLIMFASCRYAEGILPNDVTESVVWDGSKDIEVIILNLATDDMRRKFFSLPVSASNSVEIAIGTVDKLIKS